MQIDPIKPTLKAPGTKLLKLKCDKPLSNFAFEFNLRRYTKAQAVRNFTESRLLEVGLLHLSVFYNFLSMTKCVKPLRHLATSCTKS